MSPRAPQKSESAHVNEEFIIKDAGLCSFEGLLESDYNRRFGVKLINVPFLKLINVLSQVFHTFSYTIIF